MRIAGLVTTMGEAVTPDAVRSLSPWVGHLVALVDDRAPAGFAASLGVEHHPFTFADDFAAIPNLGMDLLRGRADWVVHLDADERLHDGHNLRAVIASYPGAEVIATPRRHFRDLARAREAYWAYPDLQYRVRRPHVRMAGRVHSLPAGSPATERTSLVTIEHFNLALRTPDDWDRVNAFYARLGAIP